jgi:AraC-like DNA-binding protein
MEAINLKIEVQAGREARLCWDDTIGTLFGAVDMAIPSRAGFSGRVDAVSFGEMALTTVESSGEEASRTARHITRDERAACVLSFVQQGTVSLRQAGRECTLAPGSFVLFDLQRPYRYSHRERSKVFSARIPSAALESRVAHLDRWLAVPRSAECGIGRVVRDALESLQRESSGIPGAAGADLANRIVDLVAVGLEAGDDDAPAASEPGGRGAIFRRALTFMDAHLGEFALNPARIAEAVGISVRYLHRVFEEQNCSVSDVLWRRRLARGYEVLQASPRAPIKDIAFRCGFRSHAHFCASFRREYQIAPTDVRWGRRPRKSI